jgi:hypothetical protein
MLLVTRPGYDPTEMVKGGDFVVAGMSFYTPIIEHVPHGGLEVCCGRNRERPELVGSSEDADELGFASRTKSRLTTSFQLKAFKVRSGYE